MHVFSRCQRTFIAVKCYTSAVMSLSVDDDVTLSEREAVELLDLDGVECTIAKSLP